MVGNQLPRVGTLGEILVEIMAEDIGDGFREPIRLIGPFPSGAPAIFIDQVAKLGHPCGIIGCVGDDDFGRLNVERLQSDGVDVSAIHVDPEQATGTAFVRYRENGDRDFVYNIRNSASGGTSVREPGLKMLHECGHLHVMGSSLFSSDIIENAKTAVALVKQNGGTISFDPNIRKEMLTIREMRTALEFMLRSCDVFLPSSSELLMLTEATGEAEAISRAFAHGVSNIVVKRGVEGATYHDVNGSASSPAFGVEEIDPTGAGDCFDAAFVTFRLRGESVEESLRYANACGARAVCVRGPMEGTSTLAELTAFMASTATGPS